MMTSVNRWNLFSTWMVVLSLTLAGGVAVVGCAPAEQPAPAPVDEAADEASDATVDDEGVEEVEETTEVVEEPAAAEAEEAEEPAAAMEEEAEEAEEAEEPTAAMEEEAEEAEEEQPEAEQSAEKAEEEPAEEASAEPSGDPLAVPVSKFAPAEDLAHQLNEYVEDLTEAVESAEEFEDSKSKITKDANTLVLIALGLGKHDTENEYQEKAPAIMKAAQGVAAAEEFEAAKAAVAELQKAVAGEKKAETELKWEKVASLHPLMEQVPLVNTKLKRYTRGSRFESKADDTAGYSAVLAIIAHGVIADHSEAKNDEEVGKWAQYCVEMRDAAGEANAAIRAGDEEACSKAMEALAKSCDDCHAVFHPEEGH